MSIRDEPSVPAIAAFPRGSLRDEPVTVINRLVEAGDGAAAAGRRACDRPGAGQGASDRRGPAHARAVRDSKADDQAAVVLGCACGAVFAGRGQLAAHALAVFPPGAGTAGDGKHHAPARDAIEAAFTGQYQRVSAAVAVLLGYRAHLPPALAAALECFTRELEATSSRWEFLTWAFDARRWARVAAAIAHAISSGQLRPGDSVTVARVSERYQVSSGPAREAITRLAERGILTRRGGYRTAFVTDPGNGHEVADAGSQTGASRLGGLQVASRPRESPAADGSREGDRDE